jgi:two-component system sensor histidine kinase UhpB
MVAPHQPQGGAAVSAAAVPASSILVAGGASVSPVGKILIVDDDAMVARALQQQLQDDGHRCRTAPNGLEGLAALAAEDFDLVFVDLHMPGYSGLQLLADVREMDRPVVPVVLTGHSEVSSAVEAMKRGAFDFLAKPADADAIRLVVAKGLTAAGVLRHSRAMERLAREWETTFDASPDLVAILDPSGRVLRCNRALAERYGRPKTEVIGLAFFAPGGPAAGRGAWSETLADGAAHAEEARDECLEGDFLVTTAPLCHADGRLWGVVYVARDVTERHRAEAALRASESAIRELNEHLEQRVTERTRELRAAEAKFRTLVEELPAITYIASLEEGETLYVSPQIEAIVGFAPAEWMADPRLWCDQLHPDDRERVLSLLAVSRATGQPFHCEYRLLTRTGEVLWFRDAAVVVWDELGHPAFRQGVMLDITDREQERAGRERLQTLSRRLVEVQETERRHIARELHDEIGQTLTGLKLFLEMTLQCAAETVPCRLVEALGLVNALMTQVRTLSLDLRPAMLDDLGLLPALLWLSERYARQTNLKVALRHTGLERRFPPAVETAGYRIVQEALTNVARHAQVPQVTVRVWANDEMLGVQVQDQGRGFATLRPCVGACSGLSGMRERALVLGGKLSVESAPGRGTCVTAELPLREPPEGGIAWE